MPYNIFFFYLSVGNIRVADPGGFYPDLTFKKNQILILSNFDLVKFTFYMFFFVKKVNIINILKCIITFVNKYYMISSIEEGV